MSTLRDDPVSVHISSYVWKNTPKIDPTALLVLLALADQANDEGNSWYAVINIAARCRISERQAREWLHRLADMGLIAIHERPGRTNIIQVLTPDVPRTPAADRTPAASSTSTPAAARRTPLRPTAPEPSSNRQIEPSPYLPAAHGGSDLAQVDQSEQITAQTVVQAYVDEFRSVHGSTPPTQTLARVGRDARVTLERHEYDSQTVIAAAQDAARYGHANLASAITSVLSEGTRRRTRGPATAEDRVAHLIPLIGGIQ
jgi:hypothetical protein